MSLRQALVASALLLTSMSDGGAQVARPPASTCVTGAVVDMSGARPAAIGAKPFVERLARDADVLLLGERHGLDKHTAAAACLMAELAARGPALVVEHIRRDQQAAVDQYRAVNPETVGGLGKALQWWASGWPSWRTYEPLFSIAWISRAPVYGGDRASAKPPVPSAGLEANLLAALGTQAFEQAATAWGKAMKTAHCDLIDAKRARELALDQIDRDAAMAATIESALAKSPLVVLFGGRSHVMKDMGVPLHLLAAKTPDGQRARIASIALVEGGDAEPARSEALQRYAGRVDYVWFTGEAKTDDTCSRLAAMASKKPEGR